MNRPALILAALNLLAGTTGSISGTVTDPSGLALPGVKLTLTNILQGIQNKTASDSKGVYTFPSLPVGQYKLDVESQGFKPQSRTGLRIDVDTALHVDLTMELAEKVEVVVVTESAVRVEGASTQLGEVVAGKSMTAVRAERTQLYGPAGASARHCSGEHTTARFHRHGGSNRRHRSLRRTQPRQPIDQRPT